MSLFYCHECDDICDADDGCEEAPNGKDLICVGCAVEMEDEGPVESTIVHNVTDRRHDWIGSWEAKPLDVAALTEADRGRTVIYVPHHVRAGVSLFGAEAGTLSSWNERTVWARFHKGDTAAACDPADLLLAVRTLDGETTRTSTPPSLGLEEVK